MIDGAPAPKIDHLSRIRELVCNGGTDDLDRWGDGKFVLGENGQWHYEGFVNLFQSVHEAMRSVDPSIPPGLPPHVLDPAVLARFFGIPLQDMNWQGKAKPEAPRPNPARPKIESPYLDAQQAADYLGMTVKALYGHVERRKLLPRPGYKKYRFTREQLDAFLRGEKP
jgi:hypothetical protein